ncbi:glucagon-1-like isoform X1 [Brachyistius frenatus]|uniref:glucagon-1-like isoform X1 n=1 Tax=Brachyistius frenatus TaxID=100188 RepID=UPI0037E93D42
MRSIRSLAAVLLVLGFVRSSWQVPLQEADGSSSCETDDALAAEARRPADAKRHSEGTFSNDYSKYLQDRKAQDFVRWLMNNKRSGSESRRATNRLTCSSLPKLGVGPPRKGRYVQLRGPQDDSREKGDKKTNKRTFPFSFMRHVGPGINAKVGIGGRGRRVGVVFCLAEA